MRTTIRLDDHLLLLAKRRALETGRTLTAVIEDALRTVLAGPKTTPSATSPIDLPVSGRGGTLPGVDLDSAASLYDIMDRGR